MPVSGKTGILVIARQRKNPLFSKKINYYTYAATPAQHTKKTKILFFSKLKFAFLL